MEGLAAIRLYARITLLASMAALGSPYSKAVDAQSPQKIERTITSNSVTMPARGYWDLPSYGMAFDFKLSSVTIYDHADGLCWRDSQYFGMQGANDLTPFFAKTTSGSLIFFASGPDGTRYHPKSIAAIPAACTVSINRTTPQYIFDAVVASLAELYPYSREHRVNWADRGARLRPRIAAAKSSQDLRDVLAELFRGVEDPHTSISGQIGGKPFRLRTFRGRDFRELSGAFSSQSGYDNFLDWVFDRWMPGQYRQAAAVLLPGTHHQALGNALVWGKLDGDVGYLAINEMTGFGQGADVEGERSLLGPALDQALTDLKGTRALVLDVSHNLGGDDEVSADIAARFADKVRPAYSKQAFRDGTIQQFEITPHLGVCYRKPVFLLTSELTASAAEVFAMRMRQLPNVVQVGEPTQGVFSDATEKGLPNGWVLSMSTEIYRDPLGRNYEGIGLAPQVPFHVIGVTSSEGDYGDAIRKAGALAAKQDLQQH